MVVFLWMAELQAPGRQRVINIHCTSEDHGKEAVSVLQLQTGAQVHNATQNIRCKFVRASVCEISVLCCFPTYRMNNICSYTDNVMFFISCKQQNIEYTILNINTTNQHTSATSTHCKKVTFMSMQLVGAFIQGNLHCI